MNETESIDRNHSEPQQDFLLACLMKLITLTGKPASASAITAGLPLVNQCLNPELFIRAAERANLAAETLKIPLEKIRIKNFPVVLLLKNNRACLLTGIDPEKKLAKIITFDKNNEETKELPLKEMSIDYSGYMISIVPTLKMSDRVEGFTPKTPLAWFWHVIFRAWPLYTETLVASFLINLFALAIPLFVMNVYDRVVPNRAIATLWVLAIGIGIVFIFDFLMKTLRSYFLDVASKNIDENLLVKIFEQALGIKMSERPPSTGAFANIIHSFESFRDLIASTTITVLIDLPFAIIFIIIIIIIGGNLAWIPIGLAPLTIMVGLLLQKPLTEFTNLSYQYANEKQALLYETLSNVELIKAKNAEGIMQSRWEQLVNSIGKQSLRLHFLVNMGIFITTFAQQLATVFVVIVGVYKISAGNLTVGGLIACTILAGRALAPASQIAALLTRYHQSVTSIQALDKIMQLPIDRPKEKTMLHHPKLSGLIEFDKVSFHYPEESLPAIQDVSFTINPGDRVGIIGRVGSGKTTISKLILGFYQPTSGTILIDDTDIQQYDPIDIRNNIGFVPQDVSLLFGTIRENITIGSQQIDTESILRAAKLAGVDEFTQHHPQGLEIQVGEGGKHLSGGQRQMIAIARAFLHDPPILVLDEPTNSMDDRTEARLKARLAKYMTNKTIILMTHRASMLSLVNRIILIDNGRVIADGPRDAVLQALAQGKIKIQKS